MKTSVSLFFSTVLAVAFTATLVSAGPCRSAVETYCKDVKTGAAIMKCLQSHDADLSAECRAHLGFFEMMPACVADADQLCPEETPSGSEVMRCLRGRQSDLSSDCKNDLRKIR